jgi:DNA polymerase III gamma/tau subunit
MEVLTDAEIRLRDAASKKILLEVALLKAIQARQAVSLDSVLKRLQDLREGKPGEPVSVPAVQPAPAPKPVRAEPAVAAPSASTAAAPAPPAMAPAAGSAPAGDGDLETLWARLLEAVGRASPFKRSQLIPAHPVSFVKNVFTIGFDPEFADQMTLVDASATHTLLQTKLSELGHPNSQFKFVKAEAPSSRTPTLPPAEPEPAPAPALAAAPAPKAPVAAAPPKATVATAQSVKEKPVSVPFNKDDFKNDPLIQKALEIFKGQIVEVRA